MPTTSKTRALRASLCLLLPLITVLHGSRAQAEAPNTAFSFRLYGGAMFMRSDWSGRPTRSERDANPADHPGHTERYAGGMAQLEVGARLLRLLGLHWVLFFDRSSGGELYRDYERYWAITGTGLGGELFLDRVRVALSAGVQWTSYPDPVVDPQNISARGPFVGLSAGYVWPLTRGLVVGGHALARLRAAEDDWVGSKVDTHGLELGALLSFGFEGRPLIR